MYADLDYYANIYGGSEDSSIEKMLKKASRQVDTLTFCRIKSVGFNNLTEFQQNIIKDVVCELAEFISENEDILDSVYSSYSINGVSMNIGNSWNIRIENGVAIPSSLYHDLSQTGLTCRNMRW